MPCSYGVVLCLHARNNKVITFISISHCDACQECDSLTIYHCIENNGTVIGLVEQKCLA